MSRLVEAAGVHFAYAEVPVLSGLELALDAGELVVLVGPNGAGKTTCLHALLGLVSPDQGVVRLGGTDIATLARVEIARRVAYVPQSPRSDFPFVVREVVAMGRTPHLGRYRLEGAEDLRAIEAALEATETTHLSERLLSALSGGERQRVHVARALAQETPLLLLDEPTSSLDVEHQLQLLDLVRSLVRSGKTALVTLHDLSLAARYADRVVVLAEGRAVLDDAPGVVLTEANLARYFRIVARVTPSPKDGRPVILPLEPVGRGGDSGEVR
jgi:iron complex transport system ATP-binding protein